MKKIISILCAIALLPIFSVSAEDEAAQVGPVDRAYESGNIYELTTPEKNIFRIAGSDKEFILLDDEDGFFVLAKDVYGTHAYDPDGTQKFDPEDSNNLAFWLNNGFLKDGNGGLKLPDEIIKYVDNDREWFTEGGYPGGNCPDDYTVKCGVVVLSQQEWLKYDEVFGVLDDIPPYGWWLRTGRGKNGGSGRVLASKTGDGRIGGTFDDDAKNSVRNYIRPAFYLKNEFFTEVRLDKIGINAGAKLAKHFSYKDFKGEGTLEYSDSEMRNFGFDVPFEIIDGNERISENILKNELKYNLSGESTKENIVCGKGQSVKTVLPVTDSICYEIILDLGTDKVSENNGVVFCADYYAEDGMTKTRKRRELMSFGGTKPSEEYVLNNTSVPENTRFILFTIETKENISGTVRFGGLFLKTFDPEVEFKTDWEPLNIINPIKDSFGVTIKCETTLPKAFTIGYRVTYDADGYVFRGKEKKVMISTEGVCETTVEMENLRRGNGVLELYVKYGYCTVKTLRKTVSILETYDWKKDNGLIRHGIVAHPDRFWASNKTIANSVYDAGFNLNRSDMAWYYIENSKKGEYDFTQMDIGVREMEAGNIKWVPILTYSSELYTGGRRNGIKSNEAMEGFADYVRAVVKHYPELDTFELWNEPNNNGFWGPKSNSNEYANFVKIISKAIKELRPDATVIAGAIDVSKNGVAWSRELFDYGIYPYIDAFSTHPYYHPALNDDAFLPKLKQYQNIIEDYGGWKDIWLTEIGWTTFGKKELEETQAKEMIKILAHSDYAGVTSTLFNITAGAEDFGLIDTDIGNRVKPNYLSTTTYYVQTQGAQFLTKLDLNPDCHTFLYRKNDKPMLISWCHTGDTAKLIFDDPVKVYDMYGNFEYEANTVEQTDSPEYIYISDGGFIYNNLKSKAALGFEEFLERYKSVLGESLAAEITKNAEYIRNSAEFSKEDVDKIYETGIEIIAFFGNDILKSENTNMMCEYNKCAMEAADLYSLKGEDYKNISEEALTEAYETYKKLINGSGETKRFTYELLRHSKKHSSAAKQAAKSKYVENGFAASEDLIAENLTKWAKAAMDIEGNENIGISFQTVPGMIETYAGAKTKESFYIYNNNGMSVKGKLRLTASNGNILYESNDIILPAKGKYTEEAEFELSDVAYGKDEFIISFEGDVDAKSKLQANIIPKVDVTFENVETPVDDITELRLKLTDKTDEVVKGSVKITPPEGWSVEDGMSFEVVPGEEVTVGVPVRGKTRSSFNCYIFDVEVFDPAGESIIKKSVPLDFTVVVKADKELSTEEFDGDISDWSNAYPTYVNVPADPKSKSSWQSADIAARVFTKWDDEYFYLLADIYDDIQNQLQHGASIYNGDSIQIAIDALNNKSASAYDSDDYEYGFALTQTGEETYAWHTASVNEDGIKPGNWSRVLRDEERKNTRYLIKIPKSDLAPMEFKEGSVIGFNYVINDANLVGTRETWFELTWGIGTRKDPASFHNWELVPFEERTDNGADAVLGIFDTEMNGVLIFTDISGHWAEEIIKSAYSKGLVKGMGNRTFAPDRKLTVAEALSLVERLSDLPDSDHKFDDVEGSDWYYKPIAKMFSAGFIPDEMVNENKIEPKRIITREEFAAVIAKYSGISEGRGRDFADKEEISAWAKNYVNAVADADIMIGDNEGNFDPKGGLTRAEACKVILKINQR